RQAMADRRFCMHSTFKLWIVIAVAGLVGSASVSACSRVEKDQVGVTSEEADRATVPGKDVKDLKTLIDCLNNNVKGKGIDAAVDCIPNDCTVTLTVSGNSAQIGCTVGTGANQCQMPRVLLTCGTTPQFEPSFTLCPTAARTGYQRIETCEVVTGTDREM